VVHDGAFQNGLLVAALGRIAGKKAHGDRIVARRRQDDLVLGKLGDVQIVGDLDEHPSAVAGAGIAPGRATVRQICENLETLFDDLVRGLAAHRRNEAEPASIMLKCRIVEPLAPR
jgi:hypothetical protein